MGNRTSAIMDDNNYQAILAKFGAVEDMFKKREVSQKQQIHQIIANCVAAGTYSTEAKRQLVVLDKSAKLMASLRLATSKQRTQLHDMRLMNTAVSLLSEIAKEQKNLVDEMVTSGLSRILNDLTTVNEKQETIVSALNDLNNNVVPEGDVDKLLH